jgi:hypothetical protein
MAEVDHVAERPAAIGALGGLDLRELAESFKKSGGLGKRRPVGKMNMIVHAYSIPAFCFGCSLLARAGCEKAHRRRERRVHQLLLARAAMGCQGAGMNDKGKRAPQAGGAFIAGAIIAGVVGGSILGQPSIGFLVGATVGAAAALLMWLRERR